MENEIIENPNKEDYLKEIEELKANTVSKAKYDEAVAENAKLIKTIANGSAKPKQEITELTKEQKIAKHKELVERLTSADGRKGIDLVKDSIEFRNLTKELYGIDPMLIKVNSNTPAEDTEILRQKMDKVENKFKECIQNCDGTEGDFLNEVRKAIDPKSYPKPNKH